jgi:hypothetical protein
MKTQSSDTPILFTNSPGSLAIQIKMPASAGKGLKIRPFLAKASALKTVSPAPSHCACGQLTQVVTQIIVSSKANFHWRANSNLTTSFHHLLMRIRVSIAFLP